jgi:ABC-type lipoprotein release transport system permease subunit
MVLSLISPLAWRNLWRHRGRTLLTMLAVAIAVAAMVVLGSLLAAWSDSAFDRTTAALTGHGQIHAIGFTDDPTVERSMPPPTGALAAALANDTVKAWAPRVFAPALIRSERESAPISLYGIDPVREAAVSFLDPGEVEGTALAGPEDRGLIIGRLLAERLQVSPGRRVVISAQNVDGDVEEIGMEVIGLYRGQPDLQKSAVFASLGQAQRLLGLGNHISEIAFLARNRDEIDALADSLARAGPDLDVKRWDELQPFAAAVIEMTNDTNTIWVFVSFALVAFGLVNTIMMVVYERMREFGLMQALGMKPRVLIAQVLLESTYLVLFGTVVGAALGAGTILAFANGLDLGGLGAGASMFGASERLYPEVAVSQMILACTVVVVLSIVASLYPVRRATRRVPITVLTRAQT